MFLFSKLENFLVLLNEGTYIPSALNLSASFESFDTKSLNLLFLQALAILAS